jgi:hypothetical protein
VRAEIKRREMNWNDGSEDYNKIRKLKEQLEQAHALLRRIREWDQLPTTADGPYWISEIDKVLARW